MPVKLTGELEISLDDLKPIIDEYVQQRFGAPVSRIEFHKGKLLAYIGDVVKEDAVKPLVSAETKATQKTKDTQKTKTDKAKKKAKTGGFKHQWSGLYGAIGKIIEKQRSRRKKFISFDD